MIPFSSGCWDNSFFTISTSFGKVYSIAFELIFPTGTDTIGLDSVGKGEGTPINNASDFAIYLLEEAHVATVTGDAFGSPNNIRISYAASNEKIKNAISID